MAASLTGRWRPLALPWGLLYVGVETVRFLDGGLSAWLDQGGATVDETGKAEEVASGVAATERPGCLWEVRSDLLATAEEVREIAYHPESAGARLVDVRTRGEWAGTCSRHYPFFSNSGHIPNAIFQGDWDTLVEGASHKIAPRLEEIAQRWRTLGILDAEVEGGETALVFCCGTGWRSSLSFLEAVLLGFKAKNYDDGFYGRSWEERNDFVTVPN